MERYVKYVESQLKQNNLLSESIPVIVPKKLKKYNYYKYKGQNTEEEKKNPEEEKKEEEKKADPASSTVFVSTCSVQPPPDHPALAAAPNGPKPQHPRQNKL